MFNKEIQKIFSLIVVIDVVGYNTHQTFSITNSIKLSLMSFIILCSCVAIKVKKVSFLKNHDLGVIRQNQTE